jgi:hypothetical protein
MMRASLVSCLLFVPLDFSHLVESFVEVVAVGARLMDPIFVCEGILNE